MLSKGECEYWRMGMLMFMTLKVGSEKGRRWKVSGEPWQTKPAQTK